jgi:methyl-accepting chemotaxis protein
MDPNLANINMWLAIMAIVSVFEALVLIGIMVGGFIVYRRAMQTMTELESRHIAPLRAKLDAILADVKDVTARVSQQTERVDQAIAGTMDRVDETAERVRHSVRDKVSQAAGVIRGIRAVIVSLLTTNGRAKPPAAAGSSAGI